jgi:anti-sigma factor RsiW
MRMFRGRLDKQNGGRAGADDADRGSGFYSLQNAPGDPWAARLDQIDRYLDATKPPEPAPELPEGAKPKKKRARWWWISRGVAAFIVLLVLIVLWLAITAPLSKSLQPIAPPEITLLAADGTPIARSGAVRMPVSS